MKFIKYNIILTLSIVFFSCEKNSTELILLGTLHSPVKNFNQDSLFSVLNKIKPDVILYEVDSTFFDENFNFKNELNSVEYYAVKKYLSLYKKTIIRPYDFTGRNSYRIEVGSRPVDNYTLKILDSFFKDNQLNKLHAETYDTYKMLNDTLNSIALNGEGIKAFNSEYTDSIALLRQLYQYDKLLSLVRQLSVFDSLKHVTPAGKSITYQKGFALAADFWDKRNKAMSEHILHFTKEFSGKRIVVLNGFFHRYYLNKILKPLESDHGFIIKNLEDYPE